MRAERLIRGTMLAGAALFVVPGAWALVDPASFYDHVARFPPYNRHLLHDLGAFQIGLGTGLLAAVAGAGDRGVALWAAAAGSAFHAVSHVLDRDLGGRSTDPLALSLVAAAFLAAALLATKPRPEVRRHATPPPAAGVRTDPAPRAPERR